MTSKSKKPKAVVMVMPYRAQVALFDGYAAMKRYFEKKLDVQVIGGDASYGCAFCEQDDNGVTWFGIVLEDDANLSTLVHECSHMVDFIFETHGVPHGAENTEVRAYTLAELVGDVCDAFGFAMERAK